MPKLPYEVGDVTTGPATKVDHPLSLEPVASPEQPATVPVPEQRDRSDECARK